MALAAPQPEPVRPLLTLSGPVQGQPGAKAVPQALASSSPPSVEHWLGLRGFMFLSGQIFLPHPVVNSLTLRDHVLLLFQSSGPGAPGNSSLDTVQSIWSDQSILKEISPKYSLEGLMLKLKLQ